MDLRAPSIRRPRSVYDIFLVTIAGTILVGFVLTIWHGTIVRIEMFGFIVLVFLWVAWAIYRVLGTYAEKSTGRQYGGL